MLFFIHTKTFVNHRESVRTPCILYISNSRRTRKTEPFYNSTVLSIVYLCNKQRISSKFSFVFSFRSALTLHYSHVSADTYKTATTRTGVTLFTNTVGAAEQTRHFPLAATAAAAAAAVISFTLFLIHTYSYGLLRI